jgi:hypothetical protein
VTGKGVSDGCTRQRGSTLIAIGGVLSNQLQNHVHHLTTDTAAMLFWALLASGQINMRKIDGWKTLATKPIDQPIDLAA